MQDILVTMGLAIALSRLVWIDVRSFRLPDVWTLPLIVAGLALALLNGDPGIVASGIGGFVAFTVFWLIGTIYHRRTGNEGLGLGDAKLFAASGTWLGYALLPHVLLISALSGLVYALMFRRNDSRGIAFGPWLALGFWLIWVGTTSGLIR